MLNKISTGLLIGLLISTSLYAASDLDDGIGGDEDIKDNMEKHLNTQFIKQNALRQAKQGKKGVFVNCGSVNSVGISGGNSGNVTNVSNAKNITSVNDTRIKGSFGCGNQGSSSDKDDE